MTQQITPRPGNPIERVAVVTSRLDERVAHLESLELPTTGYRFLRLVILDVGETEYIPDPQATAAWIEGVGGGGAGGSCQQAATNAAAAGGGGGGGWAAYWLTGPLAASYTIQIGTGAPQPAAGANPGGTGTDTIFEVDGVQVLIARGGEGGGADTVTTLHIGGEGGRGGGQPGTVAGDNVGLLVNPGSPGLTGFTVAAAQALSGNGGDSEWGAGGKGRKGQGSGFNVSGPGAGGSGSAIASGGASTVGRAGADGQMRIWEYTSATV